MQFFVPHAEPESAERIYTELAQFARSAVPPAGKRIASIHFRHDGDDWNATVGERLTGMRVETKRRKAGKVTVRTPLSDAAVVLAIFEGYPYMVVTDARPLGGKPSYWVNPFLAGQPTFVTYFDG